MMACDEKELKKPSLVCSERGIMRLARSAGPGPMFDHWLGPQRTSTKLSSALDSTDTVTHFDIKAQNIKAVQSRSNLLGLSKDKDGEGQGCWKTGSGSQNRRSGLVTLVSVAVAARGRDQLEKFRLRLILLQLNGIYSGQTSHSLQDVTQGVTYLYLPRPFCFAPPSRFDPSSVAAHHCQPAEASGSLIGRRG
ncbi:hypothetical protein RRG08_063452 [Elysia crispata]|uniref:Uncharacterized protein n=1 Tax=Elysia crispata TaxID=231223 RepID=A0AAE1AB54_9GAST|nr:hypothetical protein RRG08_063452 [Elysia crispata]